MIALPRTERPEPRKRRREFDDLEIPRHSRVTAERVYPIDVPEIMALAKAQIPSIGADKDTVLRILAHDPHAIRAIKRQTRLVGLYAYLTFNDVGLAELKQNRLNTGSPPSSRLEPPGTTPAAIYIWAIVGLGLASEMMCHLAADLRRPHLAASPIYAVPTTPAGERFILRLGFDWVRCRHPNLVAYHRPANDAPQIPVAA